MSDGSRRHIGEIYVLHLQNPKKNKHPSDRLCTLPINWPASRLTILYTLSNVTHSPVIILYMYT